LPKSVVKGKAYRNSCY